MEPIIISDLAPVYPDFSSRSFKYGKYVAVVLSRAGADFVCMRCGAAEVYWYFFPGLNEKDKLICACELVKLIKE